MGGHRIQLEAHNFEALALHTWGKLLHLLSPSALIGQVGGASRAPGAAVRRPQVRDPRTVGLMEREERS